MIGISQNEAEKLPVTVGKRLSEKIGAVPQLFKFRLSFLVVFSALFGFIMGAGPEGISWSGLLWVSLGGFLVTGASNTLNQIIEIEYDRMMARTQGRPLPTSRVSVVEALLLAVFSGIAGILILGFMFNLVTALLGIIALLTYAFVYTPLKRIHPVAVLVGAFPGALPPLIGWAAATGEIGMAALVIFMIQFIWQFPHFWAIAWLLDDDYRKAGFKMLPYANGKSGQTAFLIFVYTSLLIPASFIPYMTGITGLPGFVILLIAGMGFTFQAWKLLKQKENKAARSLMFGSFLYLPLVQIALVINKLWL